MAEDQADPDSENHARFRLPEPDRTRPIRNRRPFEHSSGEGMADDPWHPHRSRGTRSTAGSVADAVQEGYRVVEEHLRQGKHYAAHMHGESHREDFVPRSVQKLAGKSLHLVAETVAMMVEMSEMWLPRRSEPGGCRPCPDPEFGTMPVPDCSPYPRPKPEPCPVSDLPGEASYRLSADVGSRRAIRINLEVKPDALPESMVTHGLRALDPAHPPIEDLTFTDDGEGSPCVRLRVSDEQPAGVYNGVIFHCRTGRPLGTLLVEVQGRDGSP